MYNIVFSIPIHEKFEVVLDLICNIRHFNPNCGIVFHLSKAFNYRDSKISKGHFLDIVNRIGDIWINPESLRSGRNDIIQTHISNFFFVKNFVEFDYFAFCASNESFIRSNVYDYMKNFEWGSKNRIIAGPEDWRFGKELFNDLDLFRSFGSPEYKIVFSNTEGQFFKKALFEKICEKINSFYDYRKMEVPYPRDEIYFSTFARNLKERAEQPIGDIYTYSAYHFHFLWDVSRFEIDKLLRGNNHIYSIKRVDRNLNDGIRAMLRERFGYVDELRVWLGNAIELTSFNNIVIDIGSLNKNAKQLFQNWKKIPKFFTNRWKTK